VKMIKRFLSFSEKKILSPLLVLALAVLSPMGCMKSGGDVEKCLENGNCIATLEVLKVSGDVPVNAEAPVWSSPKGPKQLTVELGPQMITNPKWPDPSIKKVQIRAVQNGSDIAILLEWEDATQDNSYGYSERYTDQAAVMFPLEPGEETPLITMGNENQAVNIWQWKAAWEKDLQSHKGGGDRAADGSPTEESSALPLDRVSPVEDLNAEGFSTLTIQDRQDVQGKGIWQDNRWRVVLRRSLQNSDSNDAQFNGSAQMAVAVWNGANRERNGQKGLAGWILLRFP